MSGMRERRSEVRMMRADMVEVCWREGRSRPRRITGLLEDISASGACLQVEMPLPLGADVSWDSCGHKFSGLVRYCVYREIGYFVGVEFNSGSKWSKRAYKPQHLLDLERLMASAKK